MDIYTVRDNLKNTIAGKELLLNSFKDSHTSAAFIELNLKELKAILADIEICCQNKTE
ncbi:MAG TPA: hypothetical protein VNW06_08255 [Cytophagaceae bacterium]|jgi:hypothetical protein|nr:hypothetical protein [Cytophagaceae bacterium]